MSQAIQGLRVPGLRIKEELGRGARTVVYRAVKDGLVVALKVQAQRQEGSTARFRREAAYLACLKHPCLPRIHEVGEVEGRAYLVMEHLHGRTLGEYLGAPLPEPEVLELGLALAQALQEVHRFGLVHRDVKPDNVLVLKRGPWDLRLIDFGFAGRAGVQAEQMVGTFLYSAPEQTGMLKRPVDGRADLYALGVILFEAATGVRPFQADEVGEMLRQHAATPPPEVRQLNPAVSAGLSALIDRLLAKDPDDRFQSGLELARELRALGAGPGQGAEASSEGPFVGRERVVEELQAHLEVAREGRGRLVVVEGPAGSGKSRAVREVLARMQAASEQLEPQAGPQQASSGPLVLTGKCSEGDPVPFAPLRSALDGYLRALLREGADTEASQRFRSALGEMAPLLRRFSPQLAALLQDTPDPPEDFEVHEQFFDAVARLLSGLAVAHRGAVLVLDDLQWLDDASRRVLRRLGGLLDGVPLLILGTARNEGPARAALSRLAAEVGPEVARLALDPLAQDSMQELLASLLGGRELEQGLSDRLARRAQGSPLALQELVRGLLDSGRLVPAWTGWQLEERDLDQLELPADLLGMLVRRLEELGPRSLAVLSAAAVLGGPLDPGLLAETAGATAEEVSAALGEASELRLLERGPEGWRFVHDGVREALMSRLTPEQRRELHARAADALEASPAAGLDYVYALARHCLMGETERNAQRASRAARAAGLSALGNHAFEDAFRWLDQAARLAERARLPADLELEEALGQACGHTGRLPQALVYLERAITRTDRGPRRASLRLQVAKVHFVNYDFEKAWKELEQGFADAGSPYPRSAPGQLAVTAWNWSRSEWIGRTGLGYAGARGEELERHRVLVRLYALAGQTAYFQNRRFVTLQIALGAFYSAYRIGLNPALVQFHCGQAVLLALLGRRKLAGSHIARARKVAEELKNPVLVGHAMHYEALSLHFSGEYRRAEALARRCLDELGGWMDISDYFNAVADLCANLRVRGYYREAWTYLERALGRAESMARRRNEGHRHLVHSHASILAALGRPAEALGYLDGFRSNLTPGKELYRWGAYLQQTLFHCLEQGELGAPADHAVEERRKLAYRPGTCPFHLREFYLFQAQLRLAQAWAARDQARARRTAQLDGALAELGKAARVPAFQGHLKVLQAGRLLLNGPSAKITPLLEEAERIADQADAPWILFECYRQRARLARLQADDAAAGRAARLALTLALQHGWTLRERRLRQEFSLGQSGLASLDSRSGSQVTDSRSARLQRHLAGLLEVSLASAALLDPERQVRVVLDEIVRLLGAERAFLFLARPEGGLQLTLGRDAQGRDVSELAGYSSSLVEKVRASGRAVVVSGSVAGEDLSLTASVVAYDLRSLMAAPLKLGERLLGVVYVDTRLVRGMFTEEDVELLVALANHIAVGLETVRAAQLEVHVQTERRQRALAESMRSLAQDLSSTLALEDVMKRLVAGVFQVIPYQAALVLWRSPGAEQSVRSLLSGPRGEPAPRELVEPLEAAAREVMKSRGQWREGSIMGAPLTAESEVVGALVLSGHAASLGAEHQDLLTVFASQAATALRNAQLHEEVLEAYRKLRDSEAQLIESSKLRAVGQLAAGVAHELNNPLGAMLIGLDSVMNKLKDAAPDVLLRLDRAMRAGMRARTIIDKLLQYSRDQGAGQEVVELRSVAEDTLALLAHPLELDGIRLEVDLPEGLLVRANRNELQQVLTNLLLNARDALAGREQPAVTLRALRQELRCLVEVADNGPGIPPEVIGRVFEPFFTTKPVGKGTGLGLSVSQQLVRQQGGELSVECPDSGGSVFRLSLPIFEPESS